MKYWVTITVDTSFHDKCTLRLHNHLRKSLSVLVELDMVIKRDKDNAKEQQSCFNMEISLSLPLCKRDKQNADKYLYLSCFCRHNEKAEEQHSLLKHGLEPFARKGLIKEAEWGEH